MKMYRNGTTAHMSIPRENPTWGPRGGCMGWNSATANRQKKWLWTVDPGQLTGQGFAVTLTVRDCPADAATWAAMRRAWIRRIERKLPVIRIHWVTEWQARMVPHMHCAVYLEHPEWAAAVQMGPDSAGNALSAIWWPEVFRVEWLAVVRAFSPETAYDSQDVKEIAGSLGWLKYMSKHASRGANHYQRVGHPESWNKTGRMWGHTGEWPEVEPVELDGLSNQEFYRVRRMMRRWAEADAKKNRDWSRLAYLRRQAKRVEKKLSRFQAASEWIPEDVSLRLVDYLERENA
jgi:hypothetical protein